MTLSLSTTQRALPLAAALTLSCGSGAAYHDYLGDPAYPQDDWAVATPEDVGLRSSVLEEGFSRTSGITAMLVIRHDRLVFERYAGDLTPNDRLYIWSVTKSFMSALVGIAIDEGYIGGVEDPVVPYFAGEVMDLSPAKQRMTLEDVLTMRSGVVWDDMETYWWRMSTFPQGAGLYTLDQPMATEPGTVFDYNSGDSCILAHVVHRTTGRTPAQYADEKLFGPLGITGYRWDLDASGVNLGGGSLWITPREMARFGYLYLKRGSWKGTQVVPAAWVDLSTARHVTTDRDWNVLGHHIHFDYGYHWWRHSASPAAYQALGLHGQRIIVLPDLDMVVVLTANLNNELLEDVVVDDLVATMTR